MNNKWMSNTAAARISDILIGTIYSYRERSSIEVSPGNKLVNIDQIKEVYAKPTYSPPSDIPTKPPSDIPTKPPSDIPTTPPIKDTPFC